MLTQRVSIDAERGIVVKRYPEHGRGEPAREWRALWLLAQHPDLAARVAGAWRRCAGCYFCNQAAPRATGIHAAR